MDHDTATTFVEDAIEELKQRNALEEAEYLRMMLECDGPDVDGAVTSLIKYGRSRSPGLSGSQQSTKKWWDSSTKN